MSDLISRSTAKEEILSWAVCINRPKFLSRDDTMKVLDLIPAVDAVPVVHGRWLRILRGNYECSVCGCIPYYASNIRTLNYCPNCGAKMDGGKDNETD